MFLSAKASSQVKSGNFSISCINYEADFFSVIDAAVSPCFSQEAVVLASDTTLWGYKEIRKRACYWGEKKKLIWRILRSTNIALWQKRREKGFEKGLEVAIGIVVFAPSNIWVGNVGDTAVYFIRENKITCLSRVFSRYELIGSVRYNDLPRGINQPVAEGDTIILCTKAVTYLLNSKKIDPADFAKIKTQKEIETKAGELITAAKKLVNHPSALWLLKIV